MPATNRLTTPAGAPSMSTGYLRAPWPAWAMLQTGLQVFAVFIIVRYCVQYACSWRLGPAGGAESAAASQGQHHPRWVPDEKPRDTASMAGSSKGRSPAASAQGERPGSKTGLTADASWKSGTDSSPRHLFSRLPPPPPLTPPELSTTIFTIEDAPHRQDSFIHQPNPDYMGMTSPSLEPGTPASPSRPRRRSYHNTLPIGIPAPQPSWLAGEESADLVFSPSSYPPASPHLPPAPPGASSGGEDVGDGRQEVDVRGEIISVLDGEGAGWTRHTRVYGGGVCLACAASGGGFYGATVTPEEMR